MERAKRTMAAAPSSVCWQCLASTAPSSNARPLGIHNIISIINDFQKCNSEGIAFADDLVSATVSLDKEYISPNEKSRKSNCRKSSGSVTQPFVKIILATLQNNRPSRRNKFGAHSSSKKGLFQDAQRDILSNWCTAEAAVEDEVLLNCVCNANRPTRVSVLRISDKYLLVSKLFQAAMIPALHG